MWYFYRLLPIRHLLSLTYSLTLIPSPSLTIIQVTAPNGHICFYFHNKKDMRDLIEWVQARKPQLLKEHAANKCKFPSCVESRLVVVGSDGDAVGMDVKGAKKGGEKEAGATQSEVAPVVGSKGSKSRPPSLQRDASMSMNVTAAADTTDAPTASTAPTAHVDGGGGMEGSEGGEGSVGSGGSEALVCNVEEGGGGGGGDPLSSSEELVVMTETWKEVRNKLRDAYGTAYSTLVPMCIDSCEADLAVFERSQEEIVAQDGGKVSMTGFALRQTLLDVAHRLKGAM